MTSGVCLRLTDHTSPQVPPTPTPHPRMDAPSGTRKGLVMTLALLIGCLALGVLAATQASRPATEHSRTREAARRARFVAANPTHVNSADIVSGLCRDGLAPEQARRIADHALAQGIKPFTMWLWLEQFGAEAFGIVVAADLTHRELLTHISDGTLPDMDELKLFASASPLDLAAPPATTARARRRPPMAPVLEPGAAPALAGPGRTRRTRGAGRGDLAA